MQSTLHEDGTRIPTNQQFIIMCMLALVSSDTSKYMHETKKGKKSYSRHRVSFSPNDGVVTAQKDQIQPLHDHKTYNAYILRQ